MKIIFKVPTLLATVLLLSSCGNDGTVIDLYEYIIPQTHGGRDLAVYDQKQQEKNKGIIQASKVFIAYKPNIIYEEWDDFYTGNFMREQHITQKKSSKKRIKTTYSVSQDSFDVVQLDLDTDHSISYTFPRHITLNKAYTDQTVGTFFAHNPASEGLDNYTDTFVKGSRKGKECLIHTRVRTESADPKRIESRMEYIYCKPDGFVQQNAFDTELLSLKLMTAL